MKTKDKENSYRKNEYLISLMVSIIFSIAIWKQCFFTSEWISTNLIKIAKFNIATALNLLGFVITGLAIIVALPNKRLVRLLKRAKIFSKISSYYFRTIRFLAGLIAVSLIAVLIDSFREDNFFHKCLFVFVIFFMTTVVQNILRTISILQDIISELNSDNVNNN